MFCRLRPRSPLAVRLTAVASVVSLTLVAAATVEAARLSKLPAPVPAVVPVMLRLTVPAVQIHVLAGRGDAHRAAAGCRWRW
jgi:hypothetical protein